MTHEKIGYHFDKNNSCVREVILSSGQGRERTWLGRPVELFSGKPSPKLKSKYPQPSKERIEEAKGNSPFTPPDWLHERVTNLLYRQHIHTLSQDHRFDSWQEFHTAFNEGAKGFSNPWRHAATTRKKQDEGGYRTHAPYRVMRHAYYNERTGEYASFLTRHEWSEK